MIRKKDDYLKQDELYNEPVADAIQDINIYPVLRRIDDGEYEAVWGRPHYLRDNGRILLNFFINHEDRRYQITHSFSVDYELEEFIELMNDFGIEIPRSKFNLRLLKPLIGQSLLIETENRESNGKTYTNIIRFEHVEEGAEDWAI